MNRVPMTEHGHQLLTQELDRLKKSERPAVIQAISEARAHGDLKENAEYHAAKERQGFIEGRIQELESKLSSAQIIDVSKLPQNGRVVFGVTVDMIDQDNDQSVRYQIVGEDEADIKQQKISVQSPIARALIGKEKDEEVTIKTPGGDRYYLITDVLYL